MAGSLSRQTTIIIHAIAATIALSLVASHLQTKPSSVQLPVLQLQQR